MKFAINAVELYDITAVFDISPAFAGLFYCNAKKKFATNKNRSYFAINLTAFTTSCSRPSFLIIRRFTTAYYALNPDKA
ncbi:MAG: hypothetical protein LC116_01115 [Bacteroidetes bacterium]|nr:hypothetical protein [Bacteroidota bacterium]